MTAPPKDNFWLPDLSDKQIQIFNFKANHYPCAMPPALLASGPRETGKTLGVVHRVIRHLWETNGARAAIIGRTIKNVKDAGVCRDFTEFCLPAWLRSGISSPEGHRFEYTTFDQQGNPGPKVDGATRTWYFRVRNYWGTESEVLLYSLDHDQEVETKLKNTRFSCIYIPELDKFKDRKVFTVSYHQLRMLYLTPDQHLWVADTNPAEEGPDHFAYKIFYQKEEQDSSDAALYQNFEVMELFLDDNPWLSEQRKATIRALYRHDPDLWNRYVLGKWVRRMETGAFSDVFLPNTHVVGDCSAPKEDDWEILVPGDNCVEMWTGWDMGDVNHAAHIGCKDVAPAPIDQKTSKPSPTGKEEYRFFVLDELVIIGGQLSIEKFCVEMLELIDYWEEKVKQLYGVKRVIWHHWSDQSAWAYKSAIDSCEELIVRRVSEGRIMLAATGLQTWGSVKKRGQLLRRLLYENRILISAKCFETIEMLKNMVKIEAASKYKHPFDSLTYALSAEEPAGVVNQLHFRTARKGHRMINIAAA